MPKNSTKLYISVAIGLLCIGLGFYGTFFLQVRTTIQWIFIVLLLLTGIVSISILWGGTIKIAEKYITATNAFALLVFLVVVILNLFEPPAEKSSLKIQVRNYAGVSVLQNEKEVLQISIGKEPSRKLNLDANSETEPQMPADIDSLLIEVAQDDWQLQKNHGKAAYFAVPNNQVLTLILEPAQNRCCLIGKVIFADKKQKNLANITVQAAGVSTQTDAQGKFKLEIPIDKRLENLNIEAFTTTHKGSILCNTDPACPCNIKLTKK